MTSKTQGPKTPHEEIMNCIESTNDMVSDLIVRWEEEDSNACYLKDCPCRKRTKE